MSHLPQHRVRVEHGHTGHHDRDGNRAGPCFERDGAVMLFVQTWNRTSTSTIHEYRAADGTRRGDGWRWLPVRCNTPGCGYRALVRVSWIEELVQAEVDAQ